MTVFVPLVLVAPLLVLASAVVGLWAYGPLGWLASVLLLAVVAVASRWTTRVTLRWWRSTKAPERVPVRPAELRRDLSAGDRRP